MAHFVLFISLIFLLFSDPEVPGVWPRYGCRLQSTKTLEKTYVCDRQMGRSRSQLEGVRIVVLYKI